LAIPHKRRNFVELSNQNQFAKTMPIDSLQTLDIIEVMENFLEKRRPPEHLRTQVDLSYKIEDESVVVFELRPSWDRPDEVREKPIAKATFIKEKGSWKIFSVSANQRWEIYKSVPTVNDLREFAKLVDADKDGIFWG
jgi:glutamate synthase domain-containing protein 1